MRKFCNKIGSALLKLVPLCASIMMTTAVNSTATWYQGQEELPANAKKYRKF